MDNSLTGIADGLVETIDIGPTVLDTVHLEIPDSWQGRSLLLKAPEMDSRMVFSEDRSDVSTANESRGSIHALRGREWKLIVSTKAGLPASVLFNVRQDSLEEAAIINATIEAMLREKLAEVLSVAERNRFSQEDQEIEEDLSRRLRSLGYLEGSGDER